MIPYQDRVVNEKLDLDEKILKLKVFIDSSVFNQIEPGEQLRLKEQLRIMIAYSEILKERIIAFSI